MNTLRCVTKFLLVLLVFSLPATSSAQSLDLRPVGPAWACWYESADFTIRCLLSRAPANQDAAKVEQIRASIDRRLSNLVRVLWATPEKLADRLVFIPMWNAPYEWGFARELAESVMCGVRRDCEVSFDINADGRAPVRAAALRAGVDEAAVLAEVERQGLVLADATPPVASEVAEERPRSRRRRANAG